MKIPFLPSASPVTVSMLKYTGIRIYSPAAKHLRSTVTLNHSLSSLRKFAMVTSKSASTASTPPTSTRAQKSEGAILDFFSTLDPSVSHELPSRFTDLKAELWHDGLLQSWKEVLTELEAETAKIASLRAKAIPRVTYNELCSGLSKEKLAEIKRSGVVVVTGAVSKEEALSWKQSILDYVNLNKDHVRGFPAEDPQIFELYNTKSQTLARTHPNILNTQKVLLGLWHTSNPNTEISLSTPISYFDRLRIRKPGSRWGLILMADPSNDGRTHSIDRVGPKFYGKPSGKNTILSMRLRENQCSIFRPWQGWTSMSTTRQNEGTLRVLPMLSLSTAYVILRPFFRPKSASSASLKFEDWEVDLSSSVFPGSGMGKGQELNEKTHPHLKLDKTMIPIPLVEPGDQVYWHCDVIHAVEYQHRGTSDSSVLYIPAVPLTEHNAGYLRDQRIHFEQGLPAPDFPGGKGESEFQGRASVNDINTRLGLQAVGFEPFDEMGSAFIKKANSIVAA